MLNSTTLVAGKRSLSLVMLIHNNHQGMAVSRYHSYLKIESRKAYQYLKLVFQKQEGIQYTTVSIIPQSIKGQKLN